MAYFRCEYGNSGGGGGQPTETVLWTNPNPSVNFSAQAVTLSSPMTDFDFIEIYFKNLTSSTKYGRVYFSMKEDNQSVAIYSNNGGVRPCYQRTSDPATKLYIQEATGGNSYLIPLQVIGVTL